jgi:benzoyl-CoA reductase/2-hydroxyglutaryl-CoA dehydratase subunit BcrC/BadD/HgdB
MKPVEDAIKFSTDLALEYKIDGVVFYYLKFCPCSSIMVQDYVDAFQNLKIPMLVLPGDYAHGDEGQIRTRLEAFVEVLNERGTNYE